MPSRYRTVKRVLRFFPRRAMLHKYPLIGRFADRLRRRDYLWSLHRVHLRRAYYAGSILALLPLLGVQLPLALLLALLLRCNFMVTAGLQFISNPLTAAPLYYATHRVGTAVLGGLHEAWQGPVVPDDAELLEIGTLAAGALAEPLVDEPVAERWTARARAGIAAMTVGGVVLGLGLAFFLHQFDRVLRRRSPPGSGPRRPTMKRLGPAPRAR